MISIRENLESEHIPCITDSEIIGKEHKLIPALSEIQRAFDALYRLINRMLCLRDELSIEIYACGHISPEHCFCCNILISHQNRCHIHLYALQE